MKGALIKIDKWMVQYLDKNDFSTNFILLHPDDVKQIEEDGKVFDNIEARIKAYPNVDFKIVEGYKNYAKLIKKDVVDELANKELMSHLIDENGEFKTTTISSDDKKAWWKKGYEKAKETLYNDEQMEACWITAMSHMAGFSNSITYEEFIQSLKQTK